MKHSMEKLGEGAEETKFSPSEAQFRKEATALLSEAALGSPLMLAFDDYSRLEYVEGKKKRHRVGVHETGFDTTGQPFEANSENFEYRVREESHLRQAEMESALISHQIQNRVVTLSGYSGAFDRVSSLFDKFTGNKDFDKEYILEHVVGGLLETRITELGTQPLTPLSNT